MAKFNFEPIILQMYDNGEFTYKIADKLRLSESEVVNVLIKHGRIRDW